jgi:hypothetical protein
MKKKLVLLSVACLAALALVAGLISCGGGGDDGLVADGTINADNAGLLFGGAARSVDLMTMGVETSQMGGFGAASSEGGPGLFLRLVQEEVRRKMSGGLAAAGSYEMDVPCGAGNLHAVVSWDGPQEPVDPCTEISNVLFTATIDNCFNDPITLNGGLSVRETGSLCNPSAMAVILDNFSLSDGLMAMNADLTLSYTGLVWLGGDVYSGVLEDAVCTLSGAASGSSSWCSASVQFQSFRLEYHNQEGTITVTMSGYYRDDNLDGWVRVDTPEPLVYNPGEDWPISGRITASGTGSAEFSFSGGVLTITCDGAWVADHNSWAELCP